MNYKESLFNIYIPCGDKHGVYNTYSGALVVLEKPLQSYFTESTIHDLAKQGIVVDKNLDEVLKLEMERRAEILCVKPYTLHIEISPTMNCQAKCWYCFENDKSSLVMNDNTMNSVIKFIKEQIQQTECKELSLLFFGGEPLLATSCIDDICTQIKEYCDSINVAFYITIITNGINATPSVIDNMQQRYTIKEIQITLDGMGDTHDRNKGIKCFDKVVSNIEAICDSVSIRIRINVSDNNQDEIIKLIDYLLVDKELDGRVSLYLARVDDSDSDISNDEIMERKSFVDFRSEVLDKIMRRHKSMLLEDLLPDVKRHYCGYERVTQIMIDPSGDVYHCQRDLGVVDNAIGNINCWNNEYKGGSFFSLDLDEKCRNNCALLPICYGGCPHERKKGKPITNCENKRRTITQDLKRYVELLTNT